MFMASSLWTWYVLAYVNASIGTVTGFNSCGCTLHMLWEGSSAPLAVCQGMGYLVKWPRFLKWWALDRGQSMLSGYNETTGKGFYLLLKLPRSLIYNTLKQTLFQCFIFNVFGFYIYSSCNTVSNLAVETGENMYTIYNILNWLIFRMDACMGDASRL